MGDGMLTVGIHNEFLMDRLEDSLQGVDKDVDPLTCEGSDCEEDFASSYFRFSEEDTHVTSNQFIFPTFILGEDAEDFTFVPAGHIEGQLQDLLARTTADGMLTVGIHNEFLMDRLVPFATRKTSAWSVTWVNASGSRLSMNGPLRSA